VFFFETVREIRAQPGAAGTPLEIQAEVKAARAEDAPVGLVVDQRAIKASISSGQWDVPHQVYIAFSWIRMSFSRRMPFFLGK